MENMEKEILELSDEELLRLVNPVFNGSLLGEYSVPELFNVVSEEQIAAVKGIGQRKIKVILAVRELINRLIRHQCEKVKIIASSDDAFALFQHLVRNQTEELWVALLDVKSHVIHTEMVSRGTVNSSLAGLREIFAPAVKRMAAGILVAHNHPSGNAEPSKEDIHFTSQLVRGGNILGIPLLDHVIVATGGSVSMREKNKSLFIDNVFGEVF